VVVDESHEDRIAARQRKVRARFAGLDGGDVSEMPLAQGGLDSGQALAIQLGGEYAARGSDAARWLSSSTLASSDFGNTRARPPVE